jgi:hypothetical protein
MVYEVVRNTDEVNIGWEINRKLREGWILCGGIAVSTNARGEKVFYQAMLRPDVKDAN